MGPLEDTLRTFEDQKIISILGSGERTPFGLRASPLDLIPLLHFKMHGTITSNQIPYHAKPPISIVTSVRSPMVLSTDVVQFQGSEVGKIRGPLDIESDRQDNAPRKYTCWILTVAQLPRNDGQSGDSAYFRVFENSDWPPFSQSA